MAVLVGMEEVLVRFTSAIVAMGGPAKLETERIVLEHAEATAKDLAPVGSNEDPHPGELRDAIGVDGNALVCDVDYAASVEYGGIHNPNPHPFMRPAMHRAEAELPVVARAVYRSTVPFLE